MSHDTTKRDFAANARLPGISALAAVIGGISTCAAFVLLGLIHLFTNLFFFGSFSFADRSPAHNTLGLWVLVVPVTGGLIVGLMARYGSEKIRGHGIPEAIEAILFGKSRMSPKVAVLKPLSSGIVIGSGGPFGAEGPIIMTGGALGSLIAQCVKLTSAERKTLLVAGAAAGMTAVFGTPVAAVLLAVELLLFEWRPRSFLPVALACAVAGFARVAFFGQGPLFPLVTAPPGGLSLVSCVIAGLLSGALASGLSAALYKTEDLFGKLPIHWMWWPAIGGLVVGIGGYIEPRALGVGYDVIGDLLHQHVALQIAVAILVVKAVIWVVALGSGTSGGVLAPLLMLGAGLGTVLAPVLPGGEPALWPLVCMGATLGATLGAPLTAIVFAFGLTHDTNALLAAARGDARRAWLHDRRHEALDHDREDRAARVSHLPRVRRRSAGAASRRRGHVADGADDRRGPDGARSARDVLRRDAEPSRLSGGARRRGDRHGRPGDARTRPRFERRGCACAVCARRRAAWRDLPAGRDATCGAWARAAAGRGGPRNAAARRDRVAQRSGQAVARSLRRGAQKRALSTDPPAGIENALFAYGPQGVSCSRTSAEVDPERIV